MLTIIKYSFQEMLNKKIFLSTLVLALLFLGLYGGALYMAFDRGGIDADLVLRAIVSSQLLGAGFYFSAFIVAFLTVLGGVGTVTSEMDSGILYSILTKPLTRVSYMLGKFLGLTLMMIFFSIFMLGSVLALNILIGGSELYNFQFINILSAVLVYLLIPLTLLAIVFYLTTRFKSLATGVIVIMLFMLGVVGGFLEQVGVMLKKQELIDIGILTSLLSPMDSMYRMFFNILYDTSNSPLSVVTSGPFGSIQPPSGWMIVYTIIFLSGFLLMGLQRFNKIDL
ncbi:MAG: ABC transporter permease [Bacillota bacterium]